MMFISSDWMVLKGEIVMKFNTAQELLDYINNGFDVYSPSLEVYAFLYNDKGSICTYHISNEYAEELKQKEEYWGAYLGWYGSCLYDSEEYIIEHEGKENIIYARELHQLPIQWAEDVYDADDWEDVTK